MRIVTGGGGGWGDPLERPPEAVRADVRDGLIDGLEAERRYGVALDPATGAVDAERTATLRERRR